MTSTRSLFGRGRERLKPETSCSNSPGSHETSTGRFGSCGTAREASDFSLAIGEGGALVRSLGLFGSRGTFRPAPVFAAADRGGALAGSSLVRGKRRGGGAKVGKAAPKRASGPKAGPRGGGSLLRHDFAVTFRQLLPFLLVAVAAFLVAMPVSTAAVPDASIFNLDYTHDQLKFRFWSESLTYPIVLGAALFGVVLGVRAFRFLLVKCESTAVLSLPLSRSAVFGTRFAACLLSLVLGIGLPLVVSLVVNIAALNVWEGLFVQFAYVFCGLLVTGAVACAVAACACAVSGTVAEAVAFAAALLAGVSVAAWGLNAIMDWMLVGNAFGERLMNSTVTVASSLLDVTAPMNPLLFFAQEAADHQVFIVQHPVYYPLVGTWLLVGCWAIVLVALVALGFFLVRRRKGEKAGIAGLNVVLALVVGIVVGLAAFGGTFTLLAGLNVGAAIAASFAVFLIVSAVLLRGPLKGRSSGRRTIAVLGAEAAVLAAVLVAVGTGGLGYASAVPEASAVSRVSVSYTGSPSYLATKFDTAKAGDGSYYFSAEYTFDDTESIDVVRRVHTQLALTGGSQLGEDRSDFGGTVMPYDVVIRYTLADGSELVRYYDRATLDELSELTQLDGTGHARELARAAVTGDLSLLDDEDAAALGTSTARQAYALGDIYLSDRLYADPMLLNCDAQARSELLAALAEDIANQSVDDRYHPAGTCRGVLMFTQAGETAAETFAYGIENTVVYLTDEFEHTLDWFKQKGLDGYLVQQNEESLVESITVQRYAPFDGMNAVTEPQSAYFLGYRAAVDQQFISMQDFGTKFSTTDPSQIAELLPLAKNACYLDGGGYLLSVKLAGQSAYAYLVIPADDAPEWLVRVAG